MMKLTRTDTIIILILLALTVWSFNANSYFFKADSGSTASVYIDGKLTYKIDLSINKKYHVPVPNGAAEVEVSSGKLYIKKSPCPRQICMHQSPISNEGESLICVPNSMVIKIDGDADKNLDSVTK